MPNPKTADMNATAQAIAKVFRIPKEQFDKQLAVRTAAEARGEEVAINRKFDLASQEGDYTALSVVRFERSRSYDDAVYAEPRDLDLSTKPLVDQRWKPLIGQRPYKPSMVLEAEIRADNTKRRGLAESDSDADIAPLPTKLPNAADLGGRRRIKL